MGPDKEVMGKIGSYNYYNEKYLKEGKK